MGIDMDADEMRRLIESEVDDKKVQQEMLTVEEEIRSYYLSSPSKAFKEELRSRLLGAAQRQPGRLKRRLLGFSGYWWAAGTAAAVILIFLAGAGAGLWKIVPWKTGFVLEQQKILPQGDQDASTSVNFSGLSGIAPSNSASGSPAFVNDSANNSANANYGHPSLNISSALSSYPEIETGKEPISAPAEGVQSSERLSGTGGGNRSAAARGWPFTAVIYVETPRELSQPEALALAGFLGFMPGDQKGEYDFTRGSKRFWVTRDEFSWILHYEDGVGRLYTGAANAEAEEVKRSTFPSYPEAGPAPAAGPAITLEAAKRWMECMMKEISRLTGEEFSAVQAEEKDGALELTAYPLLNGLRFIDKPVTARFDLQRGRLVSFRAGISCLKPWKASRLLVPAEAAARFGKSLLFSPDAAELIMQRQMIGRAGAEGVVGAEEQHVFIAPAYWFGKELFISAVPPGEF